MFDPRYVSAVRAAQAEPKPSVFAELPASESEWKRRRLTWLRSAGPVLRARYVVSFLGNPVKEKGAASFAMPIANPIDPTIAPSTTYEDTHALVIIGNMP